MRHNPAQDIRERAVAVVVIELVGVPEIIVDVEIGPAVLVVVPPGGGMTLRLAKDAGFVRDIGEGAVAVVVEEMVALAVGPAFRVEDVGLDVDVEPAVAVIVAECRHAARIVQRQAAGRPLLLEGAVPLIDIEKIGRTEAADVEIQPAIVVHIREGRPLLPGTRRARHPGFLGHILELEATQVAVEMIRAGLADDEDVGPAVAVIVPDRDPRADGPEGKLAVMRAPHRGVVVMVYHGEARLFRGQGGKQGGSGTGRTRIEGLGSQAGRLGRKQAPRNQPGHHQGPQPKAVAKSDSNGWGKLGHAGFGQKGL